MPIGLGRSKEDNNQEKQGDVNWQWHLKNCYERENAVSGHRHNADRSVSFCLIVHLPASNTRRQRWWISDHNSHCGLTSEQPIMTGSMVADEAWQWRSDNSDHKNCRCRWSTKYLFVIIDAQLKMTGLSVHSINYMLPWDPIRGELWLYICGQTVRKNSCHPQPTVILCLIVWHNKTLP